MVSKPQHLSQYLFLKRYLSKFISICKQTCTATQWRYRTTRVRKQPNIALYFESETVLKKFYNLEAWSNFVCVYALRPSQQDFSHAETFFLSS